MTTILQINDTSDTLLVPSVIVPENRLTLIEAELSSLSGSLNGTVSQSAFDTLQGRVTTLETDYTTLSQTVDSKVNQADLNAEIARIDVIDEFVSEEQSIFGTTYNGLMIYGIVGGTFNGDKIVDYETIDGVKSGERTTAMPTVGTFYNTDVPGTYSGETRRHVFRKEFNGNLTEETAPRVRKITAGPDDATFITEETAGEVIVSRNGSEHIVKYRTSLLLGGSDTVYTIIEIGQSLNMAQKDQGAAPALFNQDPVNPAEWGFGGSWCLDSSGVDGFFRGPRPHQSSPVGNNRHVAINPSQLERLVPLREATHAGNGIHYETCASSMAHALVHGHCDVQTTTIHAVIGTGTTAIEDFRKFTVFDTFATYTDRNNSTPGIDDIAFVTETQEYFKWDGIKWDRQGDHYNTILAVVSAIHDKVSTLRQNTATSTPLIHEVAIKGNQGEQNNALGTTQTDYENEIIGFRDELTVDIEAITGQSGVIFLWQQCSQLTNGELSMAGNAHANLMITGAVRGLATHPITPGSSGSTHMMPRTYLAWGSATAHELAFCIDDPARKPPHALFVSKASNSATYSLNGGSGSGWQFDTDTIPAAPDGGYGYTAVDDTGDLSVTNATITGNTIVFVFDRAIDGNLQWGFGTRHYTDGGTLMPQEYAPRVNIRDGSGWTCPQTGQVNSGFLIQHGGTN